MHTVVDYDCSDCLVALAVHMVTYVPGHFPWRLVTNHLSEYGGADRASDPVLIPLEAQEARFVQQVATRERNDVLVRLLNQLIFVARGLLIFELADAAFVFGRLFPAQAEQETREVGVRNLHMYLFVDLLLLFFEQFEQIFDLFVKLVLFSDCVGLMHL